jgi:integrase
MAEAEACLKRVEANLHEIKNGRTVLPDGADIALFLLSDGKQLGKTLPSTDLPDVTLGELAERYQTAHATAVEADSIKTIAIHFRHMGTDFPIASLTRDDLQRHIDRRKTNPGRNGKRLSEKTIRKELMTFGAAWDWAAGSTPPLTTGPFPKMGLKFPKGTEKPRFSTRAEIERTISRGGLSKTEESELWARLYLVQTETDEFLGCVKDKARPPWLFPMVAFAAHTGARRSEILRTRRADVDLEGGFVTIREGS